MKNAIAWWARNPVAANLLMVGLVISGLLGYSQIGREVMPTVALNIVTVDVTWPGAAPEEMEEQVVMRIEQSLRDIGNIDKISSSAQEGFGQIVIEALPRVDRGLFVNSIKQRVDAVTSLPRDIEPPKVTSQVFRTPLIQLVVHGNTDELELKRLTEELRNEMALLSGVSIVRLSDARTEEVTIEVSEESMQRYKVTFDEVAMAIRGSSINLSAGSVRTETGDIQLRSSHFASDQSDFEKIVIRHSARGGIVRVGDVARVIDGFEEEPSVAALNGERALMLEVLAAEKTDVVRISATVRAWVADVRERLPQTVGLTIMLDAAQMYESRMSSIKGSALTGLGLVFLVLMLTLRAKVALWVTLGIATAYAATFALLPYYGVTINILSTFAFLLVLGIVVDDAIVIGESIHEQSNEDGSSDTNSAIIGTQLVAKPVFYAVITTILAFFPWFFLSGEDAELTRHISMVIVLALTFSLIEGFFILPAHLSKLKPRNEGNYLSKLQHKIELGILWFADTYVRKIVTAVLNRHYLTISVFFGFFIISVGLVNSGWVKMLLTPQIDQDKITFSVKLADGTPHSRVLEVMAQVQKAEQKMELEVASEMKDSGKGFVQNRYTKARQYNIVAVIKLVEPDTRAILAEEAAARWRALVGEIPDADKITVFYDSSSKVGINYSVSHPDLEMLEGAVESLKAKLRTFEDVYDLSDNLQSDAEEIHFSLLEGAESLGVTLADVSRQVRQAYYGEEVQRLPRNGNDVKVMVRYPQSSRNTLNSLEDFRVKTDSGELIPLLSVVEIEYRAGIKRISRKEYQRSVDVTAELRTDVEMDILSEILDNFLPEWKKQYPGVAFDQGLFGDAERAAIKEMAALYAVAFFLIYAVIAVAFRSYSLPIIVMVAIPFGFMGAVFGHLLFGVSMTLFSYFGIGAASGVLINDNLVLIDAINRYRDKGMGAYEAAIEAAVRRFRPIVLTSLTTFIGLLPMIAEQSIQAQFLKPTVISLAFGVVFATFVTLMLVPALYAVRNDIMVRSEAKKTRKAKKYKAKLAASAAN